MQNAIDLRTIKPLTQEERLAAAQRAKDAIKQSIGSRPDRNAYLQASESIARADIAIWVLCVVVLAAAFSISAIRLFHIGRETFLHSIAHDASAVIAGIAFVVLAEMAQLVTTLTLARVHEKQMRRGLYAVGVGATCVAIVGNLQIVTPWAMQGSFTFLPQPMHNPFAWLEALFPPIAVLAMAHVLKHQLLDAEDARQQRKRAYTDALRRWETATAIEAEQHPDWQKFYANALRDAIRAKNARFTVTKDALPMLTRGDWVALVHREIETEDWYEAPALPPTKGDAPALPVVPDAMPVTMQVHIEDAPRPRSHAPNNAGQTTDEITNALDRATEDASGVHVHCPHCNREFVKATRDSARLALTAHLRGCISRKIDVTKEALVSVSN